MTNLDYLYSPKGDARFNKKFFSDKKLGFQTIEHGIILPHKDCRVNGVWTWGAGGIIDSAGKFITNSFVRDGVGKAYNPPKDSIVDSSETVIYLGLFFQVWGHAITDNIRRLWFLESEYFKQEFKNCPIVYLPFIDEKRKRIESTFWRLLEILGVDLDKLQPITKPTRFDKIILPDDSFRHDNLNDGFFTEEYRAAINRIRDFALKNRTPVPNKKVFYFHGLAQVGEERLADYFKSKGYDIVRPETLTIEEQLNLMINCESFASSLGSCSHNSVFLRDNTETILIPREAHMGKAHQLLLDQVHPLNIYYVDSTMSVYDKGNRYKLYIISEKLKKFFGDKWDGYAEEDFKLFLKYVKNSISSNFVISAWEKKYYDPVLPDFMAQLKQREDLIASYNMPPRWEKFGSQLTYQTHIHSKGWGDWSFEDSINGYPDEQLDIQAIKINFPDYKVCYSVYYSTEEGWSEEVTAPEQAGTTGQSKSIFGIKIYLDEAGAKSFNILYRVHKFDGSWTAWAKNGVNLYSHGQKLNAIQIKLETKGK